LIVRRLLVIAVALLLAVQVVRNAAVTALATLHPATAVKFWADHPSVEIALGLAQIGRAAREREPIAPQTFAMIDDAASKSPLSPEPFLVRGVQAQTRGKTDAAGRAFVAAQARDPRSLPAAYFLADEYFRAGRSLEGLEEAAILARLAPGGGNSVAPFVASYAQNPSNWREMRALFRSQQWLEDSVLTVLAQDPRNAHAILAVADADHRNADSPWLAVLLRSLVKSGDYQRARAFWSTFGGSRDGGALVYDTAFSSAGPPPPFNWSLTSSTVGLAERQPGKRLHVIFYANDDGVLATQLVLLRQGTYRLQMQISGEPVHAEELRWSIRCDKSQQPVSSLGVDQVASRGWTFQIPANCPAQWLELSGRSGDIAQQSEVSITGLNLSSVGGNA
jgi:hypothetical protein